MRTTTNRNLDQYQFTVRPLSKAEGGGYLVEYQDMPGCMSDGETIEEANREWPRSAPRLHGGIQGVAPHETKARHLGRSMAPALYSKLTKQAENEGVSINSLVTAIIAEAIGANQARQ